LSLGDGQPQTGVSDAGEPESSKGLLYDGLHVEFKKPAQPDGHVNDPVPGKHTEGQGPEEPMEDIMGKLGGLLISGLEPLTSEENGNTKSSVPEQTLKVYNAKKEPSKLWPYSLQQIEGRTSRGPAMTSQDVEAKGMFDAFGRRSCADAKVVLDENATKHARNVRRNAAKRRRRRERREREELENLFSGLALDGSNTTSTQASRTQQKRKWTPFMYEALLMFAKNLPPGLAKAKATIAPSTGGVLNRRGRPRAQSLPPPGFRQRRAARAAELGLTLSQYNQQKRQLIKQRTKAKKSDKKDTALAVPATAEPTTLHQTVFAVSTLAGVQVTAPPQDGSEKGDVDMVVE
jgi:hypothetical protein